MPRDDLIFGCSTIAAHDTRAASLRLLAQASELGITHFDTARSYGAGESEVILGQHLAGRRDRTLVTTKCGLAAPISSVRLGRAYQRGVLIPGLRPALGVARRARMALVRTSLFSPTAIRTSLESSLRALGTDYVDYLLLHEATAAQANRREVTDTLQALVAEGKIRAFGIGSAYSRIDPDDAAIPRSYRVLQFEHSALAPASLATSRPGRRIFTHSALVGMRRLTDTLAAHPELVRRHSAALDLDLADSRVLPGVLLANSHARNGEGKVIFSTSTPQHLADDVAAFTAIRGWPTARLLGLRAFVDELSLLASAD